MRKGWKPRSFEIGPYFDGYETKEQLQTRQDYIRSIMTFTSPTVDPNRIGLEIAGLSEYELVNNIGEDEIQGHLEKRFVRLHSGYFPNFVEDVQNQYPNCSYVTYLNLEDVVKTGKTFTNVSVLLKYIKDVGLFDSEVADGKFYAEKVSPKLVNALGYPTVYNSVHFQNNHRYVMSMDFIKDGQFFYSSRTIGDDLELLPYLPLERVLDELSQKVDILKHKVMIDFDVDKKPKADKIEITKRYLQDYLTRVCFLGDTDFSARNHGFIYDAVKHEISASTNFDFEFAFSKQIWRMSGVSKHLEYIYQNHYDVYVDFIRRLQEISKVNPQTNKNKIQEIVESNISDPQILEKYLKTVLLNAEVLKDNFNQFEKVGASNQPQ